MIQEFNNFILEMNSSNSNNNKLDVLKVVSGNIRRILYYTYNPFLQFNLKPTNLEKNIHLINKETKFSTMFELLDSLNNRLITGHKAISEVNGFLFNNPEYKELFYLILERNLKIRVSSKQINKAIPSLIPTFNVALANPYNEKTKKKIDFKNDTWLVSRKLDGVRCLIVVNENGKASSYARSGKQFKTLSLVEKEIEELGVKNVVYDGELCIVDENGDEDFQNIMKEIGRKDHTIKNPLFQIFDFIPHKIFSKGFGNDGLFLQRISALQNILLGKKLKYIDFLEQTPLSSFEELNELNNTASEKGWEGLMLRKNDVYKGKRSNDILKVKTFHDDEYKVLDTHFGPMRYIKEGLEVEEEMLSGISIEHKGNRVRVGSGFSIDQRKLYHKNPDLILGKIITVQYFEESKNQEGEYSLRFPVLKIIHGDKREV